MKYTFLSFFIMAYLTSFAQETVTVKWLQRTAPANSDTIYYNPNQKLIWQNFTGKPTPHSDAVALTTSGFAFLANIENHNHKTNFIITVYCNFSKKNSWVLPGRASDYILNHEQHHFDITYICTNLFIKKLQATKFTFSNFSAMLGKIYTESCTQLQQMQNDYDTQTKNGQLKDRQQQWNSKIEQELNLYKF